MTTTGGGTPYPGSTGATTQLVRPARSIPPRAVAAIQRFTHTIFSTPPQTMCLGRGEGHVTRCIASRGHSGTRIHLSSQHIPCQSHGIRPYDTPRGRPAGSIAMPQLRGERHLTHLRGEHSPAFHANFT